MSEKILPPLLPSDHSTQLLSGGELSVENTNVVKSRTGHVNIGANADTTAFNESIFDHYLKFPTILFDGTISTTAQVGSNLYITEVSPSLFRSTKLTRIANIATNFRQWSGSFMIRMIFTKAIFMQTKIIAAYIPGLTLAEAETLSIADLYGCQYHAVMNPDNDNELSFEIPFISGKNWLSMGESSGVFLIKLFQPLVASQPTGTLNTSIPFTLMLSSTKSTNSPALTFRYLVAPTLQNKVIDNVLRSEVTTQISPQIKNTLNSFREYSSILPPNFNTSPRIESIVALPKTAFDQAIEQIYPDPTTIAIGRNFTAPLPDSTKTVSSLNDLTYLFDGAEFPVPSPLEPNFFPSQATPTSTIIFRKYTSLNALDKTALISLFSLNPNQDIYTTHVVYTGNAIQMQVGFVTSFSMLPPDQDQGPNLYEFTPLNFILETAAGEELGFSVSQASEISYFVTAGKFGWICAFKSVTSTYAPPQPNSSYPFANKIIPNFTLIKKNRMTNSQYTQFVKETKVAIRSSVEGRNAGSHVLCYSSLNPSDLKYALDNGNYSNLYFFDNNLLQASLDKRLLTEFTEEAKLNLLAIYWAIRKGVNVVAKVSKFVDEILTYVDLALGPSSEPAKANEYVIYPISQFDTLIYEPIGDTQDSRFVDASILTGDIVL